MESIKMLYQNSKNFSAVIPTYNRQYDLEKCIQSILNQNLLPDEILIIDDGELPMEFIKELKYKLGKKSIHLVYYKKNHIKKLRGSSESRNLGLRLAKNNILFILDDDVLLDKNFFGKAMKVWQENKDRNLIGVGGLIRNNRKKGRLEQIYNKIFGLNSKYNWDINEVGFQVWDEGIKKRKKGFYLHGGCSSYNKNLVQKLGKFRTFEGGRTALEDVDFCLRAKNKGYYFIIEPEVKVFHKQSATSREKDSLIGFKESYNRKIIFKNNCKKNFKNYLWFYWANIGWILRQFIIGHFSKGFGMIKGLLK